MLLRSAASRSQALANVQLCSREPQKRCKSFIRHVDSDGEPYYTVTKRNERNTKPAVPSPDKLYAMSDLLLDLDAEGAKNVRPYSEEDETRMQTRWGTDRKREAVRARLRDLEDEVFESRQKMSDIITFRTNISRLTSHDIMSAALRGAPRESVQAGSNTTHRSRGWEAADPRKASALTAALRVQNGIPEHALDEDVLLLKWMMLRRQQFRRSGHHRAQHAPKPGDFVHSLKFQTSIGDLRRLVFQTLSAGLDVSQFRPDIDSSNAAGYEDFAVRLRAAFSSILEQSEFSSDTCAEALVFIGNFSQAIRTSGTELGPVLGGLALKLSARVAAVEATSEYFYNCVAHKDFLQSPGIMEDIMSTMATYISLRNEGQISSLHLAAERQLLLQMATGLDEENTLSPISLRGLALPDAEIGKSIPIDQAIALYTQYITILGQLGAMRTLWKEWRTSAPLLGERMESLPSQYALDHLAATFSSAFRSSLNLAVTPGDEARQDLGLAECVALDYHSIEGQNVESGPGSQTKSSGEDDSTVQEDILTLDLPLAQYLNAFTAFTRQTSGSS